MGRVLRYASWAPSQEETGPEIGGFTDPRFRRRLSMISRMTIRALHDIMPLGDETKVYFISFRGEVNQQFKINKMLIEEGYPLPAAFSLSVFNAPPALASMALGLTAGYSAVYPPENGFRFALTSALASLNESARKSGKARLALVYADEELTGEYRALAPASPPALAFAALLSAETAAAKGAAFPEEAAWESPQRFLAALKQADSRDVL
jgi:hypothetical protein